MVFVTPFTTLILLSTLTTLSFAVIVQKPFLRLPTDAAENCQTVKDMFLDAYNTYKSVFPYSATVAHLIAIPDATRSAMMM